jgi:hypothetical protein
MSEFSGIPEGGVHSLEELYNSELVRSEFLSPTFQAKITIQYSYLVFNAASVRLFPETQYVQVLVDRKGRRVFIVPAHEYSPGRLKWANVKNGKNQSRNCLAKITCAKLFDMMDWIPENRYKVMAVYQEIEGVRLIVFNLVECEMLVTETIETGDGTTKKKVTVIRPKDWLETFGNLYRNHADAYKVDLNAHYLLPDNLSGEDREFLLTDTKQPVQPREPDPVEIMRRQYGGVEREDQEE